MRDPKRIDKMLDQIKQIWKKYPDLRLLQLLLNAVDDKPTNYYLEDDMLMIILNRYYLGEVNETDN